MKKLYAILYCCASALSQAQTFEQYFNEGVRLIQHNEHHQAIKAFEKASEINPSYAPTYFNIGIIQLALGNHQEAEKNFERTISHNNTHSKAYTNLATLYMSQNRFQEAITCYNKIIELNNADASIHVSLARAHSANQNNSLALEHLHKALSIEPNNMYALFDLGYFYANQGSYTQAIEYYKTLLHHYPHITDATCNLAHILRYQGNFTESCTYYKKTLQAIPDAVHALYGYAECCLMLGDYENGWPAFESRWKRDADRRHFAHKLWDGSSLQGKTIIVRAEYGQGDTLQFIRYAPLLKQQGATVILEAQHTLISLLSKCPYLDRVIPVDDEGAHLPDHDFQVPIMSLPYYFKTSMQTIPCPIPYISVPDSVQKLWNTLAENTSFKIGICWEGSPYYEQFKSAFSKKAIPLATFAPLASVPNVKLYSLQKMNGTEQLQSLPQGMHVHDFGPNFDYDNGRFVDTAAVINKLDLVITTDTSVAHLAGALGKPVWVLLPLVADWRWMMNRSDSPWYPSMRLFRQKEAGNWEQVMGEVVQELTKLLETKKIPRIKQPISVMAEVQIGELIDKITILQIKKERIKDPAKLKNIETELNTLLTTYHKDVPQSLNIDELWQSLKQVNEKLWVLEDDIRDKERTEEFDQRFIELARAVYYTNDERCRIKRDINMLSGSRLIEEKSYTNYRKKNIA